MKINNIKNQDSKLFQPFLDGVANLPPSNVEVIYEIKNLQQIRLTNRDRIYLFNFAKKEVMHIYSNLQ